MTPHPELTVSRHEVHELHSEAVTKAAEQGHPHIGERNGFKFVSEHDDDVDTLIDKYITMHKQMGVWYDRAVKISLLPFISGWCQKKAWYYEGFQMALSKVLSVHIHTRTDEDGTTTTTLIDDETNTTIQEI